MSEDSPVPAKKTGFEKEMGARRDQQSLEIPSGGDGNRSGMSEGVVALIIGLGFAARSRAFVAQANRSAGDDGLRGIEYDSCERSENRLGRKTGCQSVSDKALD